MVKDILNIFKCIAINIYGTHRHGRNVRKKVSKYLEKSKERFEANILNDRRPNESEEDHEMAEDYK